MRPKDRWPNTRPQLPQYPCIFVFPHVQEGVHLEDFSYCEHCSGPLSRDKGGFLIVVFGPLSIAFCSVCLIQVAHEIRRRKETDE